MFYPLAAPVNIALEWLSMTNPDQTFCITNKMLNIIVIQFPLQSYKYDLLTGLTLKDFSLRYNL